MKSRITRKRRLGTIQYRRRQAVLHGLAQNVFIDAPRDWRDLQQVVNQPHVNQWVTHFEQQPRRTRIVFFKQRRPHLRIESPKSGGMRVVVERRR